jgi:hypothetical protein
MGLRWQTGLHAGAMERFSTMNFVDRQDSLSLKAREFFAVFFQNQWH